MEKKRPTPKPDWLRVRYNPDAVAEVAQMMTLLGLHTVCREANCPNLGECYRNCQTVCVMENGRFGAVLDMKELAHHPTMQGAARLTSCRNFLPARACAGGMELEGWNIVLPLEAPAQRVTVAIPDEAVAIGIGPHEARVLRVISDLNSTVLLLRPAGTADAPLLRAVAPKDAQVQPGRTVHFSLQTDKCLCL